MASSIANGLENGCHDDQDPESVERIEGMSTSTIREALEDAIQRLEAKNVTEPNYSALHLMAASLKLPWERGIRDLQETQSNNQMLSTFMTNQQTEDLEEMLRRREAHEPIQYIIGKWDFLDYTISIRKPLLCPRPETEELVMKIVGETTESPVHILDVGCGTGVIGISLAELLPDATVEAIDIEPMAIETSIENAQFVLRDQTGGIDRYPDCYKATLVSAAEYQADHLFDVVVSNPPYIPRGDMDGLTDDVVTFESDQALCGGIDGLDVVRTIIQKLPEWCNTEAVCWMEVDPTHPQMIEELLQKDDELSSGGRVRFVSSYKDMFGKERFVKLKMI